MNLIEYLISKIAKKQIDAAYQQGKVEGIAKGVEDGFTVGKLATSIETLKQVIEYDMNMDESLHIEVCKYLAERNIQIVYNPHRGRIRIRKLNSKF